MFTHQCESCQKEYINQKRSSRFCSSLCFGAYKSQQVEKICPVCKKPFKSHASDDRVYCSLVCYHASGRKKQVCDGCGIEFERAKHVARRGKEAFCSHSCYLKNMSLNPTIGVFTCTQCRADFTKKKGRSSFASKMHFCSNGCHHEWQKTNEPKGKDRLDYTSIQVACASCGNQIERQPYRIRDYEKQFCNKKCAGKWRSDNHVGPSHPRWRGGRLPYYGLNWQAQAAVARKRDNYCCQHCGITQKKTGKKLDVHHLKPFRSFGYLPDKNDNYLHANELSNLISLCRSCHMSAEAGKIALQPMMLWVDP